MQQDTVSEKEEHILTQGRAGATNQGRAANHRAGKRTKGGSTKQGAGKDNKIKEEIRN